MCAAFCIRCARCLVFWGPPIRQSDHRNLRRRTVHYQLCTGLMPRRGPTELYRGRRSQRIESNPPTCPGIPGEISTPGTFGFRGWRMVLCTCMCNIHSGIYALVAVLRSETFLSLCVPTDRAAQFTPTSMILMEQPTTVPQSMDVTDVSVLSR